MRVLLTTDTIGGVWTFTKELSRGLLQRGHSVALVSFGRAPSKEQLNWELETKAAHTEDFCYYNLATPLEWMNTNAEAYEESKPLLHKVVDDFSPDLLHTSQFCFGALPIPIPKLITAHSDVMTWADACRPRGLPRSTWLSHYRLLVQHGLDSAEAVAAPTRWMLDALSSHFQLPAERQVVLNGRDLNISKIAVSRLDRAISLGRLWDEGKNLALLGKVQSSHPIVVAGESQLEGHDAGVQLARVTMLGNLGEVELITHLLASSIYIATSIYEPFGLAPLEAALCGCAIVANDLASLREVWGSAALYFKDAATLTKLLKSLYGSTELLNAAQLRSRQRAKHLSAGHMTERYCELYTQLLVPRAKCVKRAVAYAS